MNFPFRSDDEASILQWTFKTNYVDNINDATDVFIFTEPNFKSKIVCPMPTFILALRNGSSRYPYHSSWSNVYFQTSQTVLGSAAMILFSSFPVISLPASLFTCMYSDSYSHISWTTHLWTIMSEFHPNSLNHGQEQAIESIDPKIDSYWPLDGLDLKFLNTL